MRSQDSSSIETSPLTRDDSEIQSSAGWRETPTGSQAPPSNEAPPLAKGDRNANPSDIGFLALLREDLRTHESNLFDQGFWAVAVHRFANWRMGFRWKLIRAPLTLVYLVLSKMVEWTCGITLPYITMLGRRVRIWHHSGMILHARSIGSDVHIRHNTTFGVVRRNQNREIPNIEDRVDIGCGVCILGNVRVGHDSIIGANAVVLADVPPWSVVAGIPARVVKRLTPTSDAAPIQPPPLALAPLAETARKEARR